MHLHMDTIQGLGETQPNDLFNHFQFILEDKLVHYLETIEWISRLGFKP